MVSSGAAAVAELQGSRFAVCMVDLGLPDIDGMDLVKELGARHDLGIIIVTGRADRLDRVLGLELGADDFIAKPFDPRELVARVKSLIRRLEHTNASAPGGTAIRTFASWAYDRDARTVQRAGEHPVPLTPSEHRLLSVLIDHPGRVLDRGFILDRIYGNADAPFDRSVDITITRLRQKIEVDPKHPRYIRTVRSEGYFFAKEGEFSPS